MTLTSDVDRNVKGWDIFGKRNIDDDDYVLKSMGKMSHPLEKDGTLVKKVGQMPHVP